MKDEEMAEEFADEKVSNLDKCRTKDLMKSAFKDGFLTGLKVGRPQWHDLEKDPNDLPKKNGEYLCKINSHWEKYGVKHFTLQPYGYNRQWEGQGYSVIAWCEIPTFDKE